MDNADYVKHFKALGKLTYLYDQAAASSVAMDTLRATSLDQVSTGDSADLPASDLFARNQSGWANAITNGADSLQTIAVTIATDYLTSTYFTDDLTTAPATRSIANVITALETDMGAGVDNKTLGTLTTTGLVKFLNTVKGSSGTWNTESDATADYRDAIYVVSAVI